jgi:hypothetical protein
MFPPERDRLPGEIRPVRRVGRTAIGGVFLAGMAIFTVMAVAMPSGGPAPASVLYLLPGLCSGAALVTAGVLLRRREVRAWGGY